MGLLLVVLICTAIGALVGNAFAGLLAGLTLMALSLWASLDRPPKRRRRRCTRRP